MLTIILDNICCSSLNLFCKLQTVKTSLIQTQLLQLRTLDVSTWSNSKTLVYKRTETHNVDSIAWRLFINTLLLSEVGQGLNLAAFTVYMQMDIANYK